jgi:hypothetical protein
MAGNARVRKHTWYFFGSPLYIRQYCADLAQSLSCVWTDPAKSFNPKGKE